MSFEKRIPDINQYKAIIFDMDGTLIDSMTIWFQIDIDYLARFGYEVPNDLQSSIEGMSFTETAEYVKNRFQIPDSLEKMQKDWHDMAMEMYQYKLPLKPGAISLMEYCRANHIKMGVATSNSKTLVDAVVERFHLNQFIDCIITANEVKKGKPNPDVYLAVAESLKIEPKKCLVFEDVIAGIMAGKNAGMEVCAIEDSASAALRELKAQTADYFIDSFEELI